MAAAAPAPAPTRVQPGRTVKTPEYKQRKLALAERTHRTLAKPRQSRKKHAAVNYQKQVIAALKVLGKAAAPTTISKAISKAVGMTFKQVHVHCLVALRSLVARNLVSALAKNRYSLKKERNIKKKAKRVVVKKKVAAAKKKKAAAPAKKKKAAKKGKAAADGTPPKRKAAPKKKKAAEPKAKRPKKAAAVALAAAVRERGSDGPRWEYFDRTWRPYDKSALDVVEAAYQEYLRDPGMLDVRAVQSGSWRYQVDFVNMQQTNIEHANHTVRKIRRVDPRSASVEAPASVPEAK